LKILRVIASMNPAHGGPSQGIRQSIPALSELGVENEVVCCDSPQSLWMGRESFPVHGIGVGGFGFSYSSGLFPWLLQNLSRFEVVIVHGLWLWPGVATLRALKSLGDTKTSLFVMPHGMLDPWFQRDSSRRLKAIRNSFYWWLLERHLVNSAHGLLFTCAEEMRLARTTFPGYHPRREIDVGYGIAEPPANDPRLRKAFALQCPALINKPFFLFLGRINPKKGVDLLVNAYLEVLKTEQNLERFPDLLLAGPGWDSNYGREILSLTKNSPKIHTIGMQEGDAKWGALHCCEAFVLPSHQENFGLAVVEALACNKPVLISNKVNIWREISEDAAGFVESDSLAGVIRLFRAYRNQEESGLSPTRFRECFHKRFFVESTARKMRDLLLSSLCP